MLTSSLPDDIATLKRMLATRDETTAQLVAEIARLKRWHYDRSSERMTELMDQLELALRYLPVQHMPSVPTTDLPVEGETVDSRETDKTAARRRKPRTFPDHLPRETLVRAPATCDCPECGAHMRALGEDVFEMRDYVPGYFKVTRHVRPKLACGGCSKVVQIAAPSRPIAKGMAGTGLLAQVVVSKYADHTPLYRQASLCCRAGIEPDRATLASWVR